MTRAAALFALLALLVAAAARAEDHVVSQKDARFAPAELAVRVGDRVVFRNDDDITHNVFSRSEAGPFNVKLQPPGSESPVAFERPGVVDVRCAIHPKMKMRVVVGE